MNNWIKKGKHNFASHKGNRYYRQCNQTLNIDDYLNYNQSYQSKQIYNWNDYYTYTTKVENVNTQTYYNKKYYNGQSQRYNQYYQYDTKEDDISKHSTDSSNQPQDTISQQPQIPNNCYGKLKSEIIHKTNKLNKMQLETSPRYAQISQKIQINQKTLKVTRSLTNITGNIESTKMNEFFLKRNHPTKEEVLRVKIQLKDQTKDIVVYKNDDCFQIAKNFVEQNNLTKSLIQPLSIKLSLTITKINELLSEKLSNDNISILSNVNKMSKGINQIESYG